MQRAPSHCPSDAARPFALPLGCSARPRPFVLHLPRGLLLVGVGNHALGPLVLRIPLPVVCVLLETFVLINRLRIVFALVSILLEPSVLILNLQLYLFGFKLGEIDHGQLRLGSRG